MDTNSVSALHKKNHFPNMEEIGEEVYVYKGFLSKEEVDFYLKVILKQNDWIDGLPFQKPTIDFFSAPVFGNVLKKIQDTITLEDMFIEFTPGIVRMKTGKGMEEHSDDCPYCAKLKDPEKTLVGNESKRCVLYGIVVYFSEFTGGDIYYPEQGISFKPEPGDLVMHATSKYCKHGVKPVIDGTRYSVAPYIVQYHSESDKQEAIEFWNNYIDQPMSL